MNEDHTTATVQLYLDELRVILPSSRSCGPCWSGRSAAYTSWSRGY